MPPTTLTLTSGREIPWLAYGNGSGKAKDVVQGSDWALAAGITHLDTAQGYHTTAGDSNEAATGQAISRSGLARDRIYVTTKISQEGGKPWTPAVPVEQLRDLVKTSIDRLGGQPDLLLVHSPNAIESGRMREFWGVLEDLKDSGKLTADLGISNFRPQDIRELLSFAKHKPVVHQLEYHPLVLAHLDPILALHADHAILTAAYGPLTPVLRHPTGGGRLRPVLDRLARAHACDAATVLLLWTCAKGAVAVTTSGSKERIEGLARVQTMGGLSATEVEEIDRVGRQVHFRHYTEHLNVDFPAPDLPTE